MRTITPAAGAAAITTTAPATTTSALPPLQNRTPDQLKDGMTVRVRGAGADDLAVARLVQDGAQFIATAAGTTIGLKDVDINDRSVDNAGALGMATFRGTDGWFGLSQRSTQGVMEGIARLRTTPFSSWTEAQRQDFVQANEAILHEAGHVTLPAYDRANVSAWAGASRDFEEGLTEIATMTHIVPFMKDEFGVDVGPLSNRISQSTSAYTRFTERITRMIEMGTDGSPEQLAQVASLIADNTRADQREHVIAQRVADNLGGPNAPKAIVDEFEKTLEGFVAEKNGTRTKLMQLQGALVDFKAGKQVDVDRVLARARKFDEFADASQPVKVGDRIVDPIG